MSPRRDSSAEYLNENLDARMAGLTFLPNPLKDLPETLAAANTKVLIPYRGMACEFTSIQKKCPSNEQAATFADIVLPPSVFVDKYDVPNSAAEAKGIQVLIEEFGDNERGKEYRLIKARVAAEDVDDEQKQHYKRVKTSWELLDERKPGMEFHLESCGPQFSGTMLRWSLGAEEMASIFTPVRSDLADNDIDHIKLRNLLISSSMWPAGNNEANVQFLNEILWRCVYISQFKECSGHRVLEPPLRRPGGMYWPYLGPNISLDTFLYEQEVLQDEPGFDFASNTLVRMYGFGRHELRWLLRNPNHSERAEQLRTLERYHLLQSWIGRTEVDDLVEQFRFCWYAVRDSKGVKYQRLPRAKKEACIKARRRELNIAKIMVDRIWDEADRNGGKRISPVTLRRTHVVGDDGVTIVERQGDWHLLTLDEKKRLLGGQNNIHPEHGDYPRLLKIWIPDKEPQSPTWSGKSPGGTPSPSEIGQDSRQTQHAPASLPQGHMGPWRQIYGKF
jgi:hypothetical protein